MGLATTLLKSLSGKTLAAAAAAAIFAFSLPSSGSAQTYPSRPIRIIVGFAPGGAVDTLARLVAQKMGEKYGQTVVVENRPGANANIGAEVVAKAPADGYTLLMITTTHALNAAGQAKLGFDSINDFYPISQLATVPNVVLVQPSVGANTLQDFIKLAKASPGKYYFASTGMGGATHLAGESFKVAAGVDLTHIPYKGAGPALTALLSNEVSAYFGSVSGAKAYVANGQMKALAVPSPKRSSALPEVPTAAEAGLPSYEYTTWYGLLAPAKTPKDIVDKLHAEVKEIMALPDVQQRLVAEGAEPIASTPEEFRSFINTEIQRLRDVIKAANVTIQ